MGPSARASHLLSESHVSPEKHQSALPEAVEKTHKDIDNFLVTVTEQQSK
jgi:hypothetical protein